MISFKCFNILQLSSCFVCQPLKSPCDFISAALGTKGSLCDIKILPSTIFTCGNLIWLECCFIQISAQPFPWEVQRRIFGLIRGNLQMFANTRVAAETREDLPFKHSDVEYLSEVGFLGNRDHWAHSLTFGRQPLACHCEFGFLSIHPSSPSPSWIPPWATCKSVDALSVLQPSGSHWHFYF